MNSMAYTCNDWTSKEAKASMGPWVGHSWPAGQRHELDVRAARRGLRAGRQPDGDGAPVPGVYTVGTGGGYGGFYCFALTP